VHDPAEAGLFASAGELRVRDPETGARRRLALTWRTRRNYTTLMQQRRQRLTDAFYAAGMDHAFVTDRTKSLPAEDAVDEMSRTSAVLEPLMELFSARRRAS
jgi:hypothetical protein